MVQPLIGRYLDLWVDPAKDFAKGVLKTIEVGEGLVVWRSTGTRLQARLTSTSLRSAVKVARPFQYAASIVDRALAHAGTDPGRWRPLLDSLRAISTVQRDKAVAQLNDIAQDRVPAEVQPGCGISCGTSSISTARLATPIGFCLRMCWIG